MATRPPGHALPEFELIATYQDDRFNATRHHLENQYEIHMDAPTHLFSAAECETIDAVEPSEMDA